jgi:flagellin
MRELAVQAANDALSDADREHIQAEVSKLRDEVNSISTRTKFNGKALLTGALVTTQDVAASGMRVGLTLATGATAMVSRVDVSGARAGETYDFTVDVTAGAESITFTRASDSVSQTVSLAAIAAGATASLEFGTLGISIEIQNTSAGVKTAAALAGDLAAVAGPDIVTTAGSGSANIQVGAEATDFINISFTRMDISASGMAALQTSLTAFLTGIPTVAEAQDLITQAAEATDIVSEQRAALGANQNRIEHTLASLGVTVENLTAAQSRIRDADVAAETAEMARSQVLVQAAVAALAQANSVPSLALKLLQ